MEDRVRKRFEDVIKATLNRRDRDRFLRGGRLRIRVGPRELHANAPPHDERLPGTIAPLLANAQPL